MLKKYNNWLLGLTACLLGCTVSVNAQTIRVSQEEFNAGVIPQIIARQSNADVIIQLTGNRFYLSSPIEITVSSAKSVVIQGDSRNKTQLIGAKVLSGWEETSNGLWRCRIPSGFPAFDQLYVNDHAAVMARTPNRGVFRLQSVEPVNGSIKNQYRVSFAEEADPALDSIASSEHPIITIYRKWTHSRQKILSVDKRGHSVIFKGIEYPTYNPLTAQNTVIVSRYRAALDEPGEWLPDTDGYVYYYPRKGETIENCYFHIPVLGTLLRIKGTDASPVSQIEFRNIVFEGIGRVMSDSGFEPGQASSSLGAAIEIDNASRVSFVDCEIRNIANYGIWFREKCFDCTVSKCFFHDLGAGAVKIGKTQKDAASVRVTSGIVIDNNIIRDYGQEMQNAVGILVLNASDNKITHNDISNGFYTGISLGWTWGYGNSPTIRNEVAYNHIWNIGTGILNDLGGIYTLGDASGTVVHHNCIHYVLSGDFRGWGIYLDEGTANITVQDNLVYHCTSGGFHQHYGSGNVVRNNIFAFGIKNQLTFSSAKGTKPLLFSNNIVIMDSGQLFSGAGLGANNVSLEKNCYWNTDGSVPSVSGMDIERWIETRDKGSVIKDPLFRNATGSDFHFRSRKVYRSIGFIPFDYQSAGVYGTLSWKVLAKYEN